MADGAASRRQCTDRIAALPEEILREVLSRVGNVRDFFMFAVTCRWWLRRFTDPAFLRGLCPGQGDGQGHRARLLGFFFQRTGFFRSPDMRRTRAAQRASAFAPAFLPAPGSPLGPTPTTDRALTAFVADDDGTFNYAEPLAARRGNVLMQLVPRTLDGMKARSLLLGLCNPVTGERHVLPPRVLSPMEWNIGGAEGLYRYAIITTTDSSDLDAKQPQPQPPSSSSSGRFTFSQLLQIAPHKDYKVYLHSYSAATRGWSAPAMCMDGARFSMVSSSRSAVVHKGAAHWLCRDVKHAPGAGGDSNLCMLSVEASTTRVSLTNLPIRAGGSPHLCVSRDGKLSVACVYPAHVTVWTKEDEDGDGDTPAAAWLPTAFRITVPMPGPNIHPQQQPVEEWFTLSRGSMLVIFSSGVFILDLDKKVMEKVMDCFLPLLSGNLNRSPVPWCPYEVDLVEFFMLRLGNLCKQHSESN